MRKLLIYPKVFFLNNYPNTTYLCIEKVVLMLFLEQKRM